MGFAVRKIEECTIFSAEAVTSHANGSIPALLDANGCHYEGIDFEGYGLSVEVAFPENMTFGDVNDGCGCGSTYEVGECKGNLPPLPA